MHCTCDLDPGRGRQQDFSNGWYPVVAPQRIYSLDALRPSAPARSHGKRKLPPEVLLELQAKRKTQSLRQLAKQYGVSHEAVRLALLDADS